MAAQAMGAGPVEEILLDAVHRAVARGRQLPLPNTDGITPTAS